MREALRGRSGNRPAQGGQPGPVASMAGPWAHTRAALEGLERALSCSLCAGVLREPVSLGGCEHVFCLSCMGDHVGKGCPVCHVPTWVQDMQINRQLDDMVQLCSKLRRLLGAGTSDSTESTSTPMCSDFRENSKKGQIKMWLSPRSRKIRCVVNKNQPKPKSNDPCQDPSSVYHFFPSPVHEKPSKPPKKQTQRQSKKMKKKRLADVNKVWGLEKPEQKGGVEEKTSKEKCVTICSEPLVLCTPEADSPRETLQQESVKEADSTRNLEEVEVSPEVKSSKEEDNDEAVCPVRVSKEKNCAAEKLPSIESEAMPLKRGREQSKLPDTSQSKRRRSERSLNRNSGSQTSCSEDLSQDCLIPQVTEPKTPVQVCGSVMKTRSSAARSAPSLPESPSTPSALKACNQVGIPQSPSVFKSPASNTIARRNYKGETLLHIASIKGDLAAVEELLKNGADPNVKDNAGWTPLHEACNHGHQEVVELLLQHKALVNSTGYQNDSPLHDAAKNGHVSIVELLLLHGASRDAVNIFGLRPVDYAESEKMKSVLMLPVKNESFSFSQPSESPSQPRDGPLGILGSSLSSKQQKLLNQLATVLKARRCTEFNSTVTHVVIPDTPMPRTVKCMMAVLTGCWVLKFEFFQGDKYFGDSEGRHIWMSRGGFSLNATKNFGAYRLARATGSVEWADEWVQACLQSTVREQEEKYEIQDGPRRGRLNREQLLPKLFDGCYFYFLGSFKSHQKSDLVELIKAGGGQILVRQPKPDSDVTQTINTVAYHAESTSDQRFCTQYVIYDASSKFKPERIGQGKVWFAPSSWIVDCIMSFQLLPVK